VRAVGKLGLDLELLAVDAHLGYYIHEGWRTFGSSRRAAESGLSSGCVCLGR
jgi:hypothetical protein